MNFNLVNRTVYISVIFAHFAYVHGLYNISFLFNADVQSSQITQRCLKTLLNQIASHYHAAYSIARFELRFQVEFISKSGGFRNLWDINYNRFFKTNRYTGLTMTKKMTLKFDFIAPKHCSDPDVTTKCVQTTSLSPTPLAIDDDITRVRCNISIYKLLVPINCVKLVH